MLIAEAFNMPCFFHVDDDLDFYEYDSVYTKPLQGDHSFVRSLLFLQRVLLAETSPQTENAVKEREAKIMALVHKRWQTGNPAQDVLPDHLDPWRMVMMMEEQRRLMALNPNHMLSMVQPDSGLWRDIHDLLDSKSNQIAQAATWNNLSTSQKNLYHRLNDARRSTHNLSLICFQFVLYNGNSVRGLHPVDDAVLFTPPLSHVERVALVKRLHSTPAGLKYSSDGKEAAHLGYKFSDSVFAFRLMLNGKSGYQCTWFSHQQHQHDGGTSGSLVNASDTDMSQE